MKIFLFKILKLMLRFGLYYTCLYFIINYGFKLQLNGKTTYNQEYVNSIVLFASIIMFTIHNFIWNKFTKYLITVFLIFPFINVVVSQGIKYFNIQMHNTIKWIIVSTIVGGVLATNKFIINLFNNMIYRMYLNTWEYFRLKILRFKLKLFSKRNAPCPVDLTLDQIDDFGDKKSKDYVVQKGRMFEDYIANLYRTAGYNAKTTTELRAEGKLPPSIQKRGGSGEQGVDVLVEIPLKNGSTKLLAIQCKHYSNKVENAAVQEIATALAMYKADQGCVITNNYFTKPAIDLALVNNVILVDRDGLKKMIEKVVETYYNSDENKNITNKVKEINKEEPVIETKKTEKKSEDVLDYSKMKKDMKKIDYNKNNEFWKKVG